MTDSDTPLDRRSVLRMTGGGLAAATGIALVSGNAAADDDFGYGQRVEYWPCSDCDDCIDLMVDPPNGNWSRDGPTVCRGDEGKVIDTMPAGGDTQFVEVDFGPRGVGWQHSLSLDHDFNRYD